LRNLHVRNTKDELYKVIKSLKDLGFRDERILEMVKEVLNPTIKGGTDVKGK
jgi:DNA-binding transcriptional regulator YhcF (GntR family)